MEKIWIATDTFIGFVDFDEIVYVGVEKVKVATTIEQTNNSWFGTKTVLVPGTDSESFRAHILLNNGSEIILTGATAENFFFKLQNLKTAESPSPDTGTSWLDLTSDN